MTTKIHPFDQIKTLVGVHTQALEKFRLIRAGIDDPDYRQFLPCVAKDFDADNECFDVTVAGITLRCALGTDPVQRKGFIEFAHVRRDVKHPVPLGQVSFSIRNGYTDLRHFTEHADADQGDQLQLTNPFGMREVLATYFLKAAGAEV